MGVKLERKKKANYIGIFFYRLNKVLPLPNKTRFKLYLNLEWIFERLAHECSSRYYLQEEHPFRLHTKKTLLDFIKENQAVLDLGCKYGQMSVYLADKAKLVVGVDYDAKAISIAQKSYQKDNLTFICSDAYEYLNKSEIKFDVLILSHILEHLDDPEAFLKRYSPFFKYIYIELPDFEKSHLNQYRKDLNMRVVYSDDDHINEFDRDELSALIEKCRLKIMSAEYRYGLQKVWCSV